MIMHLTIYINPNKIPVPFSFIDFSSDSLLSPGISNYTVITAPYFSRVTSDLDLRAKLSFVLCHVAIASCCWRRILKIIMYFMKCSTAKYLKQGRT